jgi:hypothetical protein
MNTSEHAGNVNADDSAVDKESKLAWGAKEIGAEIERSPRQVHHLLKRGLIKSARQIGGRYCAGRAALRKEFGIG